ncbi:glutamyl-tRNA reductase [Pseudopedobacter beijingensis]|uniref:Glutamyl-tRNA reductase n=1 Tax=Pseudopedobacter beijingensis TaxID=1207056 RepID=A0ABW4IEM3_9SPHI
MKTLKVIAFTHKHIELDKLGCLVLCNEAIDGVLTFIKNKFDIPEIFYLSTCNRVEFVFTSEKDSITKEFVSDFIQSFHTHKVPPQHVHSMVEHCNIYEEEDALNHLMRVSSSLESLVVGEKEILAQVRKAYEDSKKRGYTGDFLRVIMDRVVKTAKEIYTYTNISRNPISVVSIAYRKLKSCKINPNSRILIIGAGETNQNFAKYLKKHKYHNFSVFNRTLSKAESLAKDLGGKAYKLEELANYKEGFDVIITCTGANTSIVERELYESLLNGDTDKKVIVDLAIPNDISEEVVRTFNVEYIDVKTLQDIADQNMKERYQELINGEAIIEQNIREFRSVLKQRRVEIAMREVPEKIKEIRERALNQVFAEEISSLDPNSRDLLEKVMTYMEKKYISVPMVMAKDILVQNS